MKNAFIALMFVVSFSLSVGVSFAAQGNGKAGKGDPVNQIVNPFLKQLEKAELSDEQLTKVKEVMTKAAKEVTAKRTEGGLTKELLKKRADAAKTARESGKKGKQLKSEVDAASGFTDDQQKVFDETEVMLTKARIEAGKILTAEQLEKLPANFQANLKEKESKKKKQGV